MSVVCCHISTNARLNVIEPRQIILKVNKWAHEQCLNLFEAQLTIVGWGASCLIISYNYTASYARLACLPSIGSTLVQWLCARPSVQIFSLWLSFFSLDIYLGRDKPTHDSFSFVSYHCGAVSMWLKCCHFAAHFDQCYLHCQYLLQRCQW